MATIIANKSCGNAPKKKFILDFLTAVANMEIEAAMDMLEDDAQLNIVSRTSYTGKDKIKDLIIKDGARSKITKLEIDKILSHGKYCAANGLMYFEDGSKVAFNNMYTFRSHSKKARLKLIETYFLIIH
ncbi:MAG TPA: hypothetical protein VK106_00635 [Balneolaceae bacterium]|nr:hypothetical protein [Balneolaceae bacterium]